VSLTSGPFEEARSGFSWQPTLLDTGDDPVGVVFDPSEFDFVSGSIEDRVRRSFVSISGLADASRIYDESTVDGGFVLNVGVSEYDPSVVVQIGSHFWKLGWSDVRAESVRVWMTMHQPIRTVCELRPFGKSTEPLSLRTTQFLSGEFEPGLRHVVVSVPLRCLDVAVVVPLDGE
jgi:hypothetical protein